MLFHRGCCQNKSVTSTWAERPLLHIQQRGGVRGLGGHPPLCQLALGWPCAPVPLPSGLCSDGTAAMGGGQRVLDVLPLLARVLSSMLSQFTQNALEDELLLVGCVGEAGTVLFCMVVHPKYWRLSNLPENVAPPPPPPLHENRHIW